MKKFTFLFSVLVMFLLPTFTKAQDVLVVEPGVGTLNAAIKQYGGSKIYQLKAGQWYQIDAIIENVGYHLQIIGQEPTNGGIPATLQTNADASGAVFNYMFDAQDNITLKNIYFVNADLTGVTGGEFLHQNKTGGRTIINNCIIDPVCISNGVVMVAGNCKTYFTDNLCIRMGHQLNPNDGHFFVAGSGSGAGIDTLLVENNTFVCMGTNMFAGDFTSFVHNYIKWNHNTWVLQKSQLDWSCFENAYIFTSNLMFDFQTQPWAANWQPMPGGDAADPKPALIYADTIPGETLPSSRIQYVEYNLHYRNPKFYQLVNELNAKAATDGLPILNLQPLLWPVDSIHAKNSANIPRETILFNNDTDFPNWNYGNTLTDIDPQFEDSRIYTHSDKLVEWTSPATQIHAMGYSSDNYPPATSWAQWHWDPDGDISNNATWPVFNGKYTNSEIKHGSLEKNIPLGDLNWFPEAKAAWEAKKGEIESHVLAGNTGQIDIGYTPSKVSTVSANKINIYPNPVTDQLKISKIADKAVVYDITGKKLKTVENTNIVSVSEFKSGIYFISVTSAHDTEVQKFIIQK